MILPMRRLSVGLRPKWPILIFGTALAGLALDAIGGPSGPRDLLVLRQHASALEEQRDKLRLDNTAIREHIARLTSDDNYLEQLIRQDLGYVRSGELVYRFPREKRLHHLPGAEMLNQPISY